MITQIHQGTVRGYLHTPGLSSGKALILTHGAGGNCQIPLLVTLAGKFADAGFAVLRCDLPYRQRRFFGPPPPATAPQDRDGLRDAVRIMRSRFPGPVTLGGHSYGGRQSTILAAEEPGLCDSLLLLSYPLHPPKKPAELRTAHFPSLRTPALFIHGTRDPFGAPEELTAALKLIPACTRLKIIAGAGHDLNKGNFELHPDDLHR